MESAVENEASGAKLKKGGPDTGLVGCSVGKLFQGKMYYGTITKLDIKNKLYWVIFDDNDEAEYDHSEILVMLDYGNKGACSLNPDEEVYYKKNSDTDEEDLDTDVGRTKRMEKKVSGQGNECSKEMQPDKEV